MVAIKDMEMPSSCINYDIRSGSYCYAKNKPPYNIIGNLITRADDCPLVEIEERKVGKWIRKPIRNDKGGCIGAEMICSCCNKDNRHDEYMDYCPNCGTDMREGTENG